MDESSSLGTKLHAAETVRDRIVELAVEVRRELPWPLRIVLVAEGARRFAEALLHQIDPLGEGPEPLVVRARRTEGTALRDVVVDPFDVSAVRGLPVLLVDDIADEGRTLAAVRAELERGAPASIHVAVLLDKPVRRRVPLALDFVGFRVDDVWVVGFGLDVDGRFRELDDLWVFAPPGSPSRG